MSYEIERKFLVKDQIDIESMGKTTYIKQGYLVGDSERTVRVRILGEKGFLTIKGKSNESGLTRYEWEKEIPLDEAEELLQLCLPGIIEKTRTKIEVDDHLFEVDCFLGDNKGLVIAEIELQNEDESFALPDWLGEEVTGQKKYYNSLLSKHPFSTWK